MEKKKRPNASRDYDIFVTIMYGESGADVAKRLNLGEARVNQIFWNVARAIQIADRHSANPQFKDIFSKEKYPKCWFMTKRYGELFLPHQAYQKGWRQERDKIMEIAKLLPEMH